MAVSITEMMSKCVEIKEAPFKVTRVADSITILQTTRDP